MYDKNAQFDLLFSPTQYPKYQENDNGMWRVLKDENEQAIGVLWTNGTDAAGIDWLRQTEQAVKIRKSLQASYDAGIRAADGFTLAEEEFDSYLEPIVFGPMSDISAEFEEMKQELDD